MKFHYSKGRRKENKIKLYRCMLPAGSYCHFCVYSMWIIIRTTRKDFVCLFKIVFNVTLFISLQGIQRDLEIVLSSQTVAEIPYILSSPVLVLHCHPTWCWVAPLALIFLAFCTVVLNFGKYL